MAERRYKVAFQRSAFKEYQALPKPIRARVDEVLSVLSINPLSEVLKFKKLRDKDNHYRVRIGDYYLIYAPQGDVLLVRVIRVGNRKDTVYRHF